MSGDVVRVAMKAQVVDYIGLDKGSRSRHCSCIETVSMRENIWAVMTRGRAR